MSPPSRAVSQQVSATGGHQFQDFISRVFDNSAKTANALELPLIHRGIRVYYTVETRTNTRCVPPRR